MSYANFASNVGLRVNYSLYSIPVVWTLALAPTWRAIGAAGGAFDNAPAESLANLEKKGISPALTKQMRQASAATKNSDFQEHVPFHNYSLWAIPAGWVLAMVPHFYAAALFNKERVPGSPAWDNSLPYENRSEGLKKAKLSPFMAERFLKAEHANDNSHTQLPLFAAAILAGNYARLTPRFLNNTVLFYFAARGAYMHFYINGTTPFTANLRSVSYVASVLACFALFSEAGRVLF